MPSVYTLERENLAHLLRTPLQREVTLEEIRLVSDRGQNKLVFALPNTDSSDIVAIAQPRDLSDALYEEYQKLRNLYQAAPLFFPRPEFYFETSDQSVFGMQLFPHHTLADFKGMINTRQEAQLAESIGYAMGFVYGATGMFSEQPHDLNILALKRKRKIEVKFIDAEHFVAGTKQELIEVVLNTYAHDREECVNHRKKFARGLKNGYFNGTHK
jgi:hypothetical protein